jgi:hypothetical protein
MTNGQHPSYLSPSELSGSAGHNELDEVPIPPPGPVLDDFYIGAVGFGVLKPVRLLDSYPIGRVFETMVSEAPDEAAGKNEVARIVQMCIGTHASVVKARFDILRYAEDIEAAIAEDPGIAKRFIDELGFDFFRKHIPHDVLYCAVMETLWTEDDTPEHRGFGTSLCRSVVKNQAFGGLIRTLEHVYSAIGGAEFLMSNSVPPDLRTRLFKAVHRGGRKFGSNHIVEYMFDKAMGGVPIEELGEHVPVARLAQVFLAFAKIHNLADAQVDLPTNMPPPGPASKAIVHIPRPPGSPQDASDSSDERLPETE